jgi:lipoate-protein ligase A
LRSVKLRWIPYAPHKPAWNMAVDEAILEARLREIVPPTLRFYGWAPPAVSLGYAQRLSTAVLSEIRKRGLDVVRRPTGGRAVLHEGELTYSFVGSSSDSASSNRTSANHAEAVETGPFKIDAQNLSGSVSVSYLQICQGLLRGFKNLDIAAEIGRGHGGYTRFEDCFQTTTNADLQINGLKAVGSAQLRRKSAVLQHGSILLQQSQDLMPSLVDQAASMAVGKCGVEQRDSSTKRHANLFDLVEIRDVETVEAAFVRGFNEAFEAEFERCELTEFETELAASLLSKYEVLSKY